MPIERQPELQNRVQTIRAGTGLCQSKGSLSCKTVSRQSEPVQGAVSFSGSTLAPRYLLLVHLFEFAGDLYGRHAEVEFRLKLRDERKLASIDELRARIEVDARAARDYLWLLGRPPGALARGPALQAKCDVRASLGPSGTSGRPRHRPKVDPRGASLT